MSGSDDGPVVQPPFIFPPGGGYAGFAPLRVAVLPFNRRADGTPVYNLVRHNIDRDRPEHWWVRESHAWVGESACEAAMRTTCIDLGVPPEGRVSLLRTEELLQAGSFRASLWWPSGVSHIPLRCFAVDVAGLVVRSRATTVAAEGWFTAREAMVSRKDLTRTAVVELDSRLEAGDLQPWCTWGERVRDYASDAARHLGYDVP